MTVLLIMAMVGSSSSGNEYKVDSEKNSNGSNGVDSEINYAWNCKGEDCLADAKAGLVVMAHQYGV